MAIQIRRGSDAGWESNKSNIVAGEPVITTDTGRLFVGTGNGTYEEYGKATRTVNGQPLTSDVELFAQDIPSKNLLPIRAITQTISGVTFTVNADGSVKVNGTASANALFWFLGSANATMTLPSGNYTLSGCPSGGTSSTYRISAYDSTGQGYQHDYGSGANFTSLDAGMKFAIVVFSGATLNNKVFYPMVRRSDIADDTYVPYAMTNVELSNNVANTFSWTPSFSWSTGSTAPTVNNIECYISHVFGDLYCFRGRFNLANLNGATNATMYMSTPFGLRNSNTSAIGQLWVDTSTITLPLLFRVGSDNRLFIQSGAAGGYSSGTLKASYYYTFCFYWFRA